MLTGNEIINRYNSGQIVISPFSYNNVNPNSYNLTIGSELEIYVDSQETKKDIETGVIPIDDLYRIKFPVVLDPKKENITAKIKIPEEGMILKPFELYLAKTNEYTETHNSIPFLNGRSSIGRLGTFIHCTAGFGDIGFKGNWTLELIPIKPFRIYPNLPICQICYYEPTGSSALKYSGKYQNDREISKSRLYKEFSK